MIQRSFCELSKTAFTPLYCALVRPHLEYAMDVNTPTLRADKNQLERVQRLATRLVRGYRHVPYEERLRQVKLFSLERKGLRADLTLAFKIFKGEVDLNPSEFFLRPPQAGLRAHTYRFLQGQSRLRRRSGAFSVRVVKYWSRLPAHLDLAPSVSIFKNSWTVIGSKSSLQHLCYLCPHSLTCFAILLTHTLYVFLNAQSPLFMWFLLALVSIPTVYQ